MQQDNNDAQQEGETLESLASFVQGMHLKADQETEDMKQWTVSELVQIMSQLRVAIEEDPDFKHKLDGPEADITAAENVTGEIQFYLDSAEQNMEDQEWREAAVNFYWVVLRIAAMRVTAYPKEVEEVTKRFEAGKKSDGN